MKNGVTEAPTYDNVLCLLLEKYPSTLVALLRDSINNAQLCTTNHMNAPATRKNIVIPAGPIASPMTGKRVREFNACIYKIMKKKNINICNVSLLAIFPSNKAFLNFSFLQRIANVKKVNTIHALI